MHNLQYGLSFIESKSESLTKQPVYQRMYQFVYKFLGIPKDID